MKKYELLENDTIEIFGHKLFRIRALIDFSNVKAGDLGGYIEKEENLSHYDIAWVYDTAKVYGNAKIFNNAIINNNAEISVNAEVFGNARVSDNAWVFGNAKIYQNAMISGNAKVYDNAKIHGNTWIFSNSRIYSNAEISGDVAIINNICGTAKICDEKDYVIIKGFGTEQRTTVFFRCSDGNVRVKCGHFYGTIPEFREQVKNTRTGKIANEYLKIADLMEYHFSEEDINLPFDDTCMTKD